MYTKGIITGVLSKQLAEQAAGPLNHSRWLTLWIWVQQLYTRTESPTDGLLMVVTFIQQVYSPRWFHIKSHPKFTSSHSNLHYQMELVVNQPEEVQQIVKPVIQRNAYFAEPSLLLCSMLESEEAVDKIHHIRAKNSILPSISLPLSEC